MALFSGFPKLNWREWYPGTKVTARPPAQTDPYVSDVPGFNTRFSLEELRRKERTGSRLTNEELQFLNYVKLQGLY